MTPIHMKTEAVEYALQQLKNTLFAVEDETLKLKRAKEALGIAWQGGKAADKFHKDLEILVKDFSQTNLLLEVLEQKLRFEWHEWEAAAASLSAGAAMMELVGSAALFAVTAPPVFSVGKIKEIVCDGKPDRCNTIWSKPPTNAEELAYMVMSLPVVFPIVILQIGAGEYLVLMRGTTSGEDEGSNWGSAVESMFGESSYQNSVVKALRDANLPEGSNLHFAGHSQGGMLGQNLAVDPRVTSQFDVKTVTMFGSPDTFASVNPDVEKYVSFEAKGDIVTHLDEIVSASIDKGFIDGNDADFNNMGNASNVEVVQIDRVSHGVYDDQGVLSGYEIPFETNVDAWDAVSISKSKITTPGPVIYKNIIKNAKDIAVHVGTGGIM